MRLIRISSTDKILLCGIILAPMTGFRIGKIGPAELLVFIWCILNVSKVVKIKIKNYNYIFWFFFISLIIMGTSFGVVNYPEQVTILGVITWGYLMVVSLSIYQVFRTKSYEYSEVFLKKLVTLGTIWYFSLYIYSFLINDNFFGAPLWYGDFRYTGGAKNPHQIAVLLGAFIPLLIRYAKLSDRLIDKIFYKILFAISIYLGYQTKASTLQLAIIISLVYLFYGIFLERFSSKKIKFFVNFCIIAVVSISCFLYSDLILSRVIEWVSSDPNGLGRFELFSTIDDTLRKSWLIGLGPGYHAWQGIEEYHNTYLEILAMSGILGFMTFFIYSVKIFKVYKIDIYFVSSALSLYVYGLAGFSMRRLIYWSIMALMLAISEQIYTNKTKK